MNVFVKNENNDNFRLPLATLGFYFHKTIDMLRYLTASPEVGLSQTV